MSMSRPMSRPMPRAMSSRLNVGYWGGSVDADAQAFIDAAAITDETQIAAVTTLVTDLKGAGIWDRCIAIYPFVGGSASTHKWNLKNPLDTDAAKRLTFTGAWTHSANGATPDGSTAYANTFVNLNEDVPPYSSHGSYYSRTAGIGASDYYIFCASGNGADWGIDLNSTNAVYAPFGPGTTAVSATIAGSTGLLGMNELLADGRSVLRNGVSIGTDTDDIYHYYPSTDVNNVKTILLGAYGNGVNFKSSYQCAFASFGYGLSSTMWTSLHTLVQAYQTTLGRSV